jgi:hypothetical protein
MRGIGRVARPGLRRIPGHVEALARARDQLPAGLLALAERRGDRRVVGLEHVVQQIGRALGGREPLQHDEEREREAFAERLVFRRLDGDGLRQPGADIGRALGLCFS